MQPAQLSLLPEQIPAPVPDLIGQFPGPAGGSGDGAASPA